MSSSIRIHPAIGVARVGNSTECNLAPETLTGMTQPDGLLGGLPIRPGTESDTITSADLRDGDGALRRQAVRFRLYAYPETGAGTWPSSQGEEITIGSLVDGKTVTDIIWTVHVANKKANTFVLVEAEDQPQGISGYQNGQLPPIRNSEYPAAGTRQPADKLATLNDPARVRALTIDPGPRTVSGAGATPVAFDRATAASFLPAGSGTVTPLPDYPMSFPSDTFPELQALDGQITTLGDISTDRLGRLVFAGGRGKAAGWPVKGVPAPLDDDVNNDQWFDDTADGPVRATLVFTDGTTLEAHSAWVATTDPGFAPQILNIVSLWDDIYDVWVRELALAPEIFSGGRYNDSYQPLFDSQIQPIFRAAALQQWTTNMNPHAQSSHAELNAITATTEPWSTSVAGLTAIFRDPNRPEQYSNTTLMPLALGDANESMLALRKTQHFFLTRWNAGTECFRPGPGPALGPGELLDKAALTNCLGGRFSPGIDLTFVVRDPEIYVQNWQNSGGGPFRIVAATLDYTAAVNSRPLLTAGYVPDHVYADGLEPGDLTKFMALPWHTDYNSCATHPPSPNPTGNRRLFWSWPAQRPVAVFSAADIWQDTVDVPNKAQLGQQRWSVRGPGTDSAAPENWGRFQPPIAQMLDNWHRIGVVLQAPAIEDAAAGADADWFLETGSQLTDTELTPVQPFPNYAANPIDPDTEPIDERELFHKLLNFTDNPDVLQPARAYTEYYLAQAEALSNDPHAPADQKYFPYSKQALQDRLNFIYQELVDTANTTTPTTDPDFTTRASMITRIIQFAPFNLLDGAWLRNIGETGPMDEVRSLLYSVSMDELGDGDISKNHCNIYLDLCHSVGYYPPPVNTPEFAFDPQFLQSAFTLPAFELAISQFSQDYYPELLGMTLQLEWEVVDLKPTRDLLDFFGIDSHFYVMHIGIDNAVNGHGQRAAEAIDIYLENVRASGGDEAVQAAWRRIWTGFVAFGTTGDFGQDLVDLVHAKPSLRSQVLAMIREKAEYGSLNHQQYTVGATRIDEWFADPEGFLDALVTHDYLVPGDWANSKLNALMDFETGPMFRVFTDDEIALWAAYTQSLGQPVPPPPPPVTSWARAMTDLIDELRPVQQGNPAHQAQFMTAEDGLSHSVAWWFTQPTQDILNALMSQRNQLVVPGQPGASPFLTELTAPAGPMGPIFDLPARTSPGLTRREVLTCWVTEGCPTVLDQHTTLRVNTPQVIRELHPTGRILGMGAVH
ncbi:MAG: hypothetical protein QOE23_1047 [Pseudonocardiales bacterium]|jgi:hypothetical protein|nr:hypothetical protein [Pseudonocardiales bacterium]